MSAAQIDIFGYQPESDDTPCPARVAAILRDYEERRVLADMLPPEQAAPHRQAVRAFDIRMEAVRNGRGCPR